MWSVLAVLAACANHSEVPVARAVRLHVGMSRDDVRALLGPPRSIEYGTVEFWLYAPDAMDRETLPIGFVDGRIVGWGKDYYDRAHGGRVLPDGSVPRDR